MFEQLTGKFQNVFDRLKRQAKLDEKNVEEALRQVRLSLLEADVNFKVVKEFTEAVKGRALGEEVQDFLAPGQQFVKIFHEELIKILGNSEGLSLSFKPPVIVLLVGLQGSGKTTTAAKIALHLQKKQNRYPYLVSVDVYRPAAIEQLHSLARKNSIPFHESSLKDPVKIAESGIEQAKSLGRDVVLIDTAGRLQIDDVLMKELGKIREKISPNQILFVADAMTGQEAVNVAVKFNQMVPLDGVVLTKMDGDARGGAALSLKHVLGKPILYIGTGEKTEDLELFHPDRVASRILGMGDVLSLIEKMEDKLDLEKAKKMTDRVLKQGFTLLDFQEQLGQIKKLGALEKIVQMIPGASQVQSQVNFNDVEADLKRKRAILSSMTIKEKLQPKILNGSRRLRIAKGSGTQVQDVNRLIKEFEQMKKMMDKFGKFGLKKIKQFAQKSLTFQ